MLFRFYRWSVRGQLLWLAVLVLLPVLAALFYDLAVARQAARDFAYERVRILASNTAANLDRMLLDNEGVLWRIAQRPAVRALDQRACDPIIAEYIKLYPEFTNLVVRDLAGKNDCSFLGEKLQQPQMAAVPGFEQAVSAKSMTVGEAFVGPLSGRWISTLFFPVSGALGRTTGLVALPMDLRQLETRLLGALPASALVVVIDKSGKIIMRSRDGAHWAGKIVPAAMARQASGQTSGDFSALSADRVQRLFSYVRLSRADWVVVAGVPEDDVLADSNAAFRGSALLVLGVLALTLGLAWRISAGIARPIDALSRVAAAVASGQTSRRVELRSGPQELLSVARQFNHMLDARERAQQALGDSEARFRTLADLSSDWYWEQDEQFRFTRFDGNLQEGTGIAAPDYVGKTRWELSALNLTAADWDRHRAVLEAHQQFRKLEIERPDASGRVRWGEVSGVPIFDDQGRFRGYRGVGTDIGERKRLEQERLGLSLHIEELSRRLVTAQEQARRRFSRELHDRTSPNLAALRLNLDIITMASPAQRSTQAFADRVDDSRALIEDTTLSIREICAELHPPVLDIGGLLGVVQSYAQQLATRTGMQVHVTCAHGDVRLASDLELSLFRIVQEALTNCAKHARARKVEVILRLDSDPMVLSIVDDGCGFEVGQLLSARQRRGLGLINMQETAEFSGGKFQLESRPGVGTRVDVEIKNHWKTENP